MKKRAIAAFMAAVMSVVMMSPVVAEEPEVKTYYSLETDICLWSGYRYSETFDYMLVEKGDETRVYVKAEDVANIYGYSASYAEGEVPYQVYSYSQAVTECAYVNPDANLVIRYLFDSDLVYMVFLGCEMTYTAPFEAVCENGVAWVPFDFMMKLLGCDAVVDDSELTVYAPTLNQFCVIEYLYHTDELTFDWTKEGRLSSIEALSDRTKNKLINIVSGILSLELPTITSVLTAVVGGTNIYTNELSEVIAQLYLVPAESEIKVDGELATLSYPLTDVLEAEQNVLG